MKLGPTEKQQIQGTAMNISKMLRILEETNPLQDIFLKLEPDSDEAHAIRSAKIRMNEADNALRAARAKLMQIYS